MGFNQKIENQYNEVKARLDDAISKIQETEVSIQKLEGKKNQLQQLIFACRGALDAYKDSLSIITNVNVAPTETSYNVDSTVESTTSS